MMDGITAGMLLNSLKDGADSNSIADLYKEINREESDGPSVSDSDWVNNNLGKKVKIIDTFVIGTIHSLNESKTGFYSGDRYPVYVRDDKLGRVEAWAVADLELI